VPDLTTDTCPTCGLPAEVVAQTETEASARCILMHDFTIAISAIDVRKADPAPVSDVAPFRTTPVSPAVSTRPEWARRMAWFAFGALAALLLLRAPAAALVLIPLSLPLIAVESARKSWRPVGTLAKAMDFPTANLNQDEGRKAA
jgi:hypothetical protein